MAKKSGRKVKIIYSGNPIAGAITDTLTITREPIDGTSKSDNGVRTYINELAVTSMSMSCEGRQDGDVLHALARDATTALHTFTFEIEGEGSHSGSFCITSFEVNGPDADVATFSASFESSGVIAWTAA